MYTFTYPQAIRKAPQHSATGFKQTANKFAVVVQLLLGEIPDRATFRGPILRKLHRPILPACLYRSFIFHLGTGTHGPMTMTFNL